MLDANTVDPMDPIDPEDEFWTQTEILTHVRDFARSRAVAPWATLGGVLRRAVGCIEPWVVLPATVGTQVSLNLFTVPAGRSGAGKDAANGAGRDAVDFTTHIGGGVFVPVNDAAYIHPGSGEGLARIFKGRKGEPGVSRAHLQVNDVATLEALAGRQGHTLVGQLLGAYMGQPLGFNNNAKDTSTAIEAHSYRLCLSVGVQPDNAGFFLSREKDGLPQRFLWLPTTDPYAPEIRPDPVNPIAVEVPAFTLDKGDRFVLDIPDHVRQEIWSHRHRVLTGADGVDPLDGHLMLTQLKAAAAVAILHGRTSVTDDDWKIAAEIIGKSQQTLDGLRVAVADRRRRENTAKALDAADRQAIIDDRLTDERQKRVAKAITNKFKRVGRATRTALRRACDVSIRGDFDPVFDLFVDKGFLVCHGGQGGHADEYELAPEKGRGV
jgi:hypothetical protein